MVHKILRDKKSSAQINLHHKVVFRLRHIPKIGAFLYAGVVHQNVNLAHFGNALGNHAAVIGGVGQVASDHVHLAAKFGNGVGGLLRTFSNGAVVHNHICAFLRQSNGNGLSNALSASGDQRDLA